MFVGAFVVVLFVSLLAGVSISNDAASSGEFGSTLLGAVARIVPLGVVAAVLVSVPVLLVQRIASVPWPITWLVGIAAGFLLGLPALLVVLFLPDPEGIGRIYAFYACFAGAWCAAIAVPLYLMLQGLRRKRPPHSG